MEREIIINNLHIHYRIAGKGQFVLILHGWGGSSRSWIKVQDILAQNNFQVIVPDLPGFGKSEPPKVAWDINAYVKFVKEFCDKMGLDNFNLIGHSFGGRISIKFSVQYPEMINNLILVDSAGIKPKLDIKDKAIFSLAKIAKNVAGIKAFTPVINKIRLLFYKTILRKKDYAKLNGTMKITFRKVIYEDLLSYLGKIRIKTLLIWGEKDKMVPISYAYTFKDRILNSELKIIPNIGHSPNIYSPQKLSQLIINFISKND